MLNLGSGIKLLGSFFVAFASIGFALQIKRDLREHLALLYELRRLFVSISYEEAFSMQPIEQMFLQGKLTKEKRLDAILMAIAGRLMEKQSESGEGVWQEEFEKNKDILGLSEEELDIIKNAGLAFFGKSIEENKRQLNLVLERLDFLVGQTRKEQKEKQKVYQTLSVVCGFMLIILFL